MLSALAGDDQIRSTLSELDGVNKELEYALRTRGCALIKRAGILSDLPQATICTAQVLLQRFYYVSSLYHFSIQDIAIGALYLSSKLEETELGIRDIINVFHRLTNSQADEEYQPMSYYGPTYYEWKDSLVVAEMQILKRLAFDVYVQQPYALLVNYINVLDLSSNQGLSQRAWSYLNDSLLTPANAIFSAPTIACACLDLACRDLSVALPTTSDGSTSWYELFDCSLAEMECTQLWILRTYAALNSEVYQATSKLISKYNLREYLK
ncbi:cyclin-like protein [Wallemia mellicola CBS 633.66]|uniref:Cyclin-like protein n=2 Tax=Wallemia mellicola TaxID=1708541 RepID=I4Y543_WALMC|nr:cyclin-like protein [Wallemia mellicola CBS 633.66]EIM19085.1 cyclin-like protein [Wallemia mellicola CBS 633.66]TIB95112.1 cyclin-like protein [Wallemia mellicola]TIC60365.1 cyclin-like protein [Wallemia mellicola]|eukprot:XP_006960869.1 cyclin-like protein [Wallemia mellicola CBS 633.66]